MGLRRTRFDQQSWEADVDAGAPYLDAYPRERRWSLDEWIARADAKLDRDCRVAEGPALDIGEVKARVQGIVGPNACFVELMVAKTVALLIFGSDKRGAEEMLIREERVAPFVSPGHALEVLFCGHSALGTGPIKLQIAEDRDEDVKARGRARCVGRELPTADARGFLPADFMKAKTSRSGSIGGSRNEDSAILRVDVERAVRASRVGFIDLALVVAHDVGEPKELVEDGLVVGATLRAGELATRLNAAARELEVVSAVSLGKRIARSRMHLAEALVDRGLMPGSARVKRYGVVPVPGARQAPVAFAPIGFPQ